MTKKHEDLDKQVTQLEQRIAQRMSKEAWERYSRVKLAHPYVAYQALALLAQSAKQGSTAHISDESLKNLLKKIK